MYVDARLQLEHGNLVPNGCGELVNHVASHDMLPQFWLFYYISIYEEKDVSSVECDQLNAAASAKRPLT